MSDPMLRPGALKLAIMLWCIAPAHGSAQESFVPADPEARAARIAELAARVDSLAAAFRQEQNELIREQQRPDTTLVDTIRIGPMLLLAPSGVDVGKTARVLEDAWSAYASVVGSAATRIEGNVTMRAMPRSAQRAMSNHTELFDPYQAGSRGRRDAADRVVSGLLTAALPGNTKDWLARRSISLDAQLEIAYRTLAVAGNRVSQECHAGSVNACVEALGLHRADAAVSDPSLTRLRPSLVAYALQQGGEDSYARLFADSSSIEAQLSSAARMPVETLVANWGTAVRLARPSIRADVGRSALWTFAWLALLALFAARSTRWRLG